jgi:hypothetical protein
LKLIAVDGIIRTDGIGIILPVISSNVYRLIRLVTFRVWKNWWEM